MSGGGYLYFEAVNCHATAWVNGEQVGQNTDGKLPFSFDITKQVKAGPKWQVENRDAGIKEP